MNPSGCRGKQAEKGVIMKSGNGRKEAIIVSLLGCIPVIWLALLVAPFAEQGLAEVLINSDKILKDPFDIRICEGSLKTAALFLAVYIMSICIYHTSRRNYRKGEEHGSAQWGDPSAVNRKYHQRPDTANKLLTQHVRIGIDGRKHRRNLNVLVCGGSGAGKTRFYCKPNIMQANTSFVVLDPKGGAIRSCMKSARAQLNN